MTKEHIIGVVAGIVFLASLYVIKNSEQPAEEVYQPRTTIKSTFSVNEQSAQKIEELNKEVVSKKQNAMIQKFKKSDMAGVRKFNPQIMKKIDEIVVTHWAINKAIKENDIEDLKTWSDGYEDRLTNAINKIDEIMLETGIDDAHINNLLKKSSWNNEETMNTVRQKNQEALDFLNYFKENKNDF